MIRLLQLHTTLRSVAAGALLCPAALTAAVYRCTPADGPPHFSQFPCGNGESVVLEPMHTVRIPALSDAERELLNELEQQRRAERERRVRTRRRAARDARAQQQVRSERCETARAARATLEDKRRKGYSIGEAKALERREVELEDEIRRNC